MENGSGVSNIENPRSEMELTVRKAARALGNHGLVHAYGHCSQRIDENYFLVCAPKPLATIEAGDHGTIVPIHGDFPDGVLGEVRIHREIYRLRPDVGGVVRSMPKQVMSLSALGRTPRILHGMSSYFAPNVPLWNDPQLIRNDEAAQSAAELLGNKTGIVLRGNGAVVTGDSLKDAVVLTWYLEDAARIELDCLPVSKEVIELGLEEAKARATRSGQIFERMWDYLTHGDPE